MNTKNKHNTQHFPALRMIQVVLCMVDEKAVTCVLPRVAQVLVARRTIPHCLPFAWWSFALASAGCFGRKMLSVDNKVMVNDRL